MFKLLVSEQQQEFDAEVKAIANILRVHQAHIDKVRSQAEMLASEAAETTAEGIKDLVDEDAEVDAAAQAALVRQASNRAIYAVKRLRHLESLGSALAFGYTTAKDGEKFYVGRHSVIDDEEALLVDWRARAAEPFYRATFGEPLGMVRRRHFIYDKSDSMGSENLADFSDEVFDVDQLQPGNKNLRGEAAVLASVQASTDTQMRSVVATIQAEQDRIVRADSEVPLVVQGGPGTGKTVVALHRAAYLLYHHRVDLEDTGILVVGPSTEFLNYISQVLPSLGESGVVSVTTEKLYPGIKLGLAESNELAELKGRIEMAELLERYIKLLQRKPVEDLQVWYGSTKVVILKAELDEIFEASKSYQFHNEGSAALKKSLVNLLIKKVYNPSFDNISELRSTFKQAPEVNNFCSRCWPQLNAESALNDLFSSKAILENLFAESGLTDQNSELLFRKRSKGDTSNIVWSSSDVALLDELAYLIDGLVGDIEAIRESERDITDEFEEALVHDAKEAGFEDTTVSLDSFDDSQDPKDPIPASDFWREPDENLDLFPIMYDQAEQTKDKNVSQLKNSSDSSDDSENKTGDADG